MLLRVRALILDIFAQRARTHEGKLQVELAQLKHMSTRLIRGWTHLERQKGGIGLRGPGETQLETDRRLLRARIRAIEGRPRQSTLPARAKQAFSAARRNSACFPSGATLTQGSRPCLTGLRTPRFTLQINSLRPSIPLCVEWILSILVPLCWQIRSDSLPICRIR